MYAPGGNHTQLLGYGVGANAGVTYKGASVDGYYTKQNGGVNLDAANGLAGSPFTNSFKYTISNNEAWGGAAKYGFDLGGGFKDEPSSKVTLFAGYVHITTSNADKAQDAYLNEQTSGDLSLALANKFSPYESNRIIQTEWFGASYETGPWALTATWYRENQNTYLSKATSASTAINNNGGDVDWVSGVVDYKFNKHFDVYAGVTWVGFTGDWATGQAHTDDVTVASGVRLKF
jgi:predicted porin